jgi:hypothetical protein
VEVEEEANPPPAAQAAQDAAKIEVVAYSILQLAQMHALHAAVIILTADVLCGARAAGSLHRQLDEEPPAPPPPPPAPLPPYPTAGYIFNVTRLNKGLPIISYADNSSEFPFNAHATWAPDIPTGPDLLSGGRRLDETEPTGGGVILQVQDNKGVSSLALVPQSDPTKVAPGDSASENFGIPGPTNVILAANNVEENIGVGTPSVLYQTAEDESDRKYLLIYTAESRNNLTQQHMTRLHLAVSSDPTERSSWQRLGPVFDTYPLNATSITHGVFVPGSANWTYMFFTTSSDRGGVFPGVRVARTQVRRTPNWARSWANFSPS